LTNFKILNYFFIQEYRPVRITVFVSATMAVCMSGGTGGNEQQL